MSLWGRVDTTRTTREHDKQKLGVFATMGNILAYTDHTTPPQCWTAAAFDVHSVGEICTSRK